MLLGRRCAGLDRIPGSVENIGDHNSQSVRVGQILCNVVQTLNIWVLQEFSSLPRALFCVRKNKPQIFPLSGHKRIGRQRNRTSAAKAGYRSTLYGTAEAVP